MKRVVLAVIAAWLALTSLATAQDTTKPWAFLSPDANLTAPPGSALPLDLRANVTQSLYLYVVNPIEDVPTSTIEVRAGNTVIATAEDRTPGKSIRKVTLRAAPPPAGASANAGTDLSSMQFTIAVGNKNKPDDSTNDSVQGVKLRNPASFLGDTVAVFYGTDHKLVVKVAASDFQGPPCTVELAVDPNEVPGLVKDELKGVTRGQLSAQQREITLFASGLSGATGEGMFSLTVDGVERAVVYRGNFQVAPDRDSGRFVRVTEQGVSVRVPAFARPGQDVVARVATANAPDTAKLLLTFGQGDKTNRVISQTFNHNGPRDQGATVTITPEGALAVASHSRAWAPHLDTRGIYGSSTVVVTMTTDSVSEGRATIVLDDTPPKGEFDVEPGKPVQSERGVPLPVRLTAEDPESGIARVELFVGAEPPVLGPDGKAPAEPKPILAEAVTFAGGAQATRNFAAKLQIPDSKVPVPVYARFINGVGLTAVRSINVVVIDPPNPVGSIKGQVYHGNLLQKNLVVTLYTPKWEVVKTARIDKDGFFEFKELTPGEYKLGSEFAARKLKGYAAATVKASKAPTEIKLEIKQ